jgi:hypothetical protein
VQRDEHAVEFFGGQFGQRALGRVERVGVDAFRLQGLQHAGAGQDRDLALGGAAAEQDADLAQGDVGRSEKILTIQPFDSEVS